MSSAFSFQQTSPPNPPSFCQKMQRHAACEHPEKTCQGNAPRLSMLRLLSQLVLEDKGSMPELERQVFFGICFCFPPLARLE